MMDRERVERVCGVSIPGIRSSRALLVVVLAGVVMCGMELRAWPASWDQASPVHAPSKRNLSAMAFDPATDSLLLFGGVACCFGADGQTWSRNGTDWAEQSPENAPSPGHCATMATDDARSNVVLFGGRNLNPGDFLTDTWTFRPSGTVFADDIELGDLNVWSSHVP